MASPPCCVGRLSADGQVDERFAEWAQFDAAVGGGVGECGGQFCTIEFVVGDELIEVGEARQLVEVALGGEPPHRMWSPETIELVRRPLTALALAARLAVGGDGDVSRLQLLQDLPQTIIRKRRPNSSTPEVWEALARLATLILESRGPLRATGFGNEAEVWQLTDTGLVVERDGQIGFALPVFEQHFGAQVITSESFRIEQSASRSSFPTWRYAIATNSRSGCAHRSHVPRRVGQELLQRLTVRPRQALADRLDRLALPLQHQAPQVHRAPVPLVAPTQRRERLRAEIL